MQFLHGDIACFLMAHGSAQYAPTHFSSLIRVRKQNLKSMFARSCQGRVKHQPEAWHNQPARTIVLVMESFDWSVLSRARAPLAGPRLIFRGRE
jgi:hypothetical protein